MDYDPGILAVPRRLFSQNYVDGGCEGEPPANTKIFPPIIRRTLRSTPTVGSGTSCILP